MKTDATTACLAYSVRDSVRISGIGRTSIYNLINSNRLATVRIGSRRLVLAASLHKLLSVAEGGDV